MSSAIRSALVSAAVVVVTALAAWAATSTREVLRFTPRPGLKQPIPVTLPLPAPATTRASWLERAVSPALTLPTWVWVLAGIAAATALAVLLGRRLADRPRRARVAPPAQVDGSAVAVAAVTTQDVDQARAALARGTARNGIVACWAHLERLAGEAGHGPRPTDTAADLARRLADAGAPAGPLAELAGLYEEARFSRHPVDESRRERATVALDALRAALGGRR